MVAENTSTVYRPRMVDALLAHRLRHHPAVLIVGPRACGKTTTAARMAGTTIRLDHPAEAAVVRADPDAALRDRPEPILIDEWQVVPEVLGAVKRAVDREPRPGRYLITGSVRGDVDSPTWPGTGRLLRVAMYGLTIREIRRNLPDTPLLDRLAATGVETLTGPPKETPDLRDYAAFALLGGFPEPVLRLPPSERRPWLDSYIEQLLTRDVLEASARRDPDLLRRYFEAYALNTAGAADQETIRAAAGVARATATAYEQLLRNLLVVEAMPAWWTNRLKRLVRAPKRYFVDSSLALAAIHLDLDGLMKDAGLLGRALDTFVAAQLRAELACCASSPRLFHLRQEQGRHEVDLVIEYGGGRLFGLEVKTTSAPAAHDARHLVWLRDMLGERFIGGAVLHTGPRSFMLEDRIVASPIASLWRA
jgi:uncharacterized protein